MMSLKSFLSWSKSWPNNHTTIKLLHNKWIYLYDVTCDEQIVYKNRTFDNGHKSAISRNCILSNKHAFLINLWCCWFFLNGNMSMFKSGKNVRKIHLFSLLEKCPVGMVFFEVMILEVVMLFLDPSFINIVGTKADPPPLTHTRTHLFFS